MSEEVSSSSTAVAGSKHAREEQGDAAETSLAKRRHLDEDGEAGPCTSSTGETTVSGSGAGGSGEGVTGSGEGVTGSGEGVTSESDEEFQIGGDSSADEGGDDAESSDISAEEVEEEEEGEGGNDIICGQCVELRHIKDEKYRLYHQHSGREIKMLLSHDSVSGAVKLAREKQSDNQIAVLEAQGAEVTRDDHDEVIVYATSLSATDTKYRFCNEEINPDDDDKTSVLLQGNEIVVLRVDGLSEVFGTGDFNTQEIED